MDESSAKNDKGTPPSVAIDGARIKGVRETKKLTQLYVANVVGVTTDTISRWENNRYPSIKRDNAEKLASALEVELSEILRQEEPAAVEERPARARTQQGPRRLLAAGLGGLALVLIGVFFLARYLAPAPTAVRWLPRFAAPGETIPVQIKITRQGGEHPGFILKEFLPHGWRLVSTQPSSSSADPARGIKWLIPGSSTSSTVSYTVEVPEYPAGQQARLSGEIVLPAAGVNRSEAVGGDSELRIGPYHWADANGDGKIDDDEIMPAYYICEEIKGLDWKTIEAIWSGKGYRWDPKNGYTVIK